MTIAEIVEALLDRDMACDICRFSGSCAQGVTGTPTGPSYPPCADGDPEKWVDEDLALEVYSTLNAELLGQ